jgi:hypothetical protein
MVSAHAWKQFKHVFVLILVWAVLDGIVVTIAYFAGGGASITELFDKMLFYFAFCIIGILTMSVFAIWKAIRPNSAFANSFIFDPDQGVLPNEPIIRFNRSFFWTFILFFNLTAAIGLGSAYSNTFFLATPQVIQQITEASKLILETEPAALAETMVFVGFLVPLLVGLVKYSVDRERTLGNVLIFAAVPVIIGLIGVTEHLLVYGEQQTALVFTFLFWTISAYLTLITGSFLAAYIWHFNNNFYVEANRLFANDQVFLVWIISMILINVLLIGTRVLLSRRQQKRLEVVSVA